MEPKLKSVYVPSDDPITQYRNKDNFFLLTHMPYLRRLSQTDWYSLEAGHGKGAADGVGEALEWSADQLVAEGRDLLDAKSMFETFLKNGPRSPIQLFRISDNDIRLLDEKAKAHRPHIRPVRGTMGFHKCRPANLTRYRVDV